MIKKIVNSIVGNYLPCYVINRAPLIIISYWEDFMNNRATFLKSLPDVPNVYVICQLGWQYEDESRVISTADDVMDITSAAPQIKFIFLCNSAIEEENFKKHNLNGIYCHQNAFLNENNYRIIPNAAKLYDAIYIARITPFKRHLLAANIPRLKIIGDYYNSEQKHVDMIMQGLPQAIWKRKAFSFNIYKEINQAHTGLCLSEEEGAMFVSAEYLLCGIPLVSTPNKGGRDGLFTPEHVYIAENNAVSVAAGVQELINRKIPAQEIRSAVIAKMLVHRKTFITIVQNIYTSEGIQRNFKDEWDQVFIHKLGIRCTVMPWIKLRRGVRARA